MSKLEQTEDFLRRHIVNGALSCALERSVAIAKVVLVDGDDVVRSTLAPILEQQGFDITVAPSLPEALKYIDSETDDVLLSDLNMPGAGDGLTVVSAMCHANPSAVTLLLSAVPEMTAAADAIRLMKSW